MRMRTPHQLLVHCKLKRRLSQEEIAGHLMTWVAPVYPAIAQGAHVQGDVAFKVELCSRWPCEVDESNQWAAHVQTTDSRRAEAVEVLAASRWRRGNCGNR